MARRWWRRLLAPSSPPGRPIPESGQCPRPEGDSRALHPGPGLGKTFRPFFGHFSHAKHVKQRVTWSLIANSPPPPNLVPGVEAVPFLLKVARSSLIHLPSRPPPWTRPCPSLPSKPSSRQLLDKPPRSCETPPAWCGVQAPSVARASAPWIRRLRPPAGWSSRAQGLSPLVALVS